MKPSFAAILSLLPVLAASAAASSPTTLPVNKNWGIGAYGGKVGVIRYEDRWIPDDIEVKSSKNLLDETSDVDELTLDEGASVKPVEEDNTEESEKEDGPVTVTSISTVYTTTTVSRTHGPVEAEATPAPPVRRSMGHHHQKRQHGHARGVKAKRFVTVGKQ